MSRPSSRSSRSSRKTSTEIRPFVKWAGGKRRVVPELMVSVPERFGCYHEPFLGGGAFFFALFNQDRLRGTPTAVLSDNNERLVRTWCMVRDDVEALNERLREHAARHDKDYFYEVRSWRDIDERGDLEVAAWLLYLNKTAFNGLYRVNSKGHFNVPFGRYANPNICRPEQYRAASRALQGVEIRHEPFTRVARRAQPGDLVYFDPPYIPLSTSASFTAYTRQGFGPEDQQHLRDLALELKERGVHVVLSNHDHEQIRELYAEPHFERRRIGVGRAINSKGSRRGKVGELIIT